MRLFIAINLPEDERKRIHAAAAGLRAVELPIKWVDAESIHLTLKFLGDVPESKVLPVHHAVEAAARSVGPFELRVGGFGAFPTTHRARVVWAGADGGDALVELQKAVEAACGDIGFLPEDRPFTPHLTLGRVRDGVRARDLKALPALLDTLSYEGIAPVGSLDLMHSHLSPRGARYERVHTVALERT